MSTTTRIVIMGGGPAGYEAALVAAQYGADVTLIERDGPGGSSVLFDCVPSKTFIASAGGRTATLSAGDLGIDVPEGVSATVGMKGRHSTAYILGMWGAVTVASALAAMVGYAVLGGAGDTTHAVVQAFAAGAILTMLTDTMVPEATKHADKVAGVVTALGFTSAFLLSMA